MTKKNLNVNVSCNVSFHDKIFVQNIITQKHDPGLMKSVNRFKSFFFFPKMKGGKKREKDYFVVLIQSLL